MTTGVHDRRAFSVLTRGKDAEVEELLTALGQIEGVEASFRAGQDGVRVVIRRVDRTFSVSIYPATRGAVERLIAMYLNDWGFSQQDSEDLTGRVLSYLGPPSSRRLPSYLLVEVVPSPVEVFLLRPKELFVGFESGRAVILHRKWGLKAKEGYQTGTSTCSVVDRRMKVRDLCQLLSLLIRIDSYRLNNIEEVAPR